MGGHKIQKNQKNGKPNHIVFLCHIVSIQVDKQGLNISKPDKSCIYPLMACISHVRWATPRGRYDAHSSKFSLRKKPRFIEPGGAKKHVEG